MLHLTLSHWPGIGHMFCYWLELLSPSCVTSVWRAARPAALVVGWAKQAADILSGSFPTQQHHTEKTVIRPASHYFFISDVQWLDVGILMLQSFEPSQTKERPRAILGRLQVSARPPSKYESGSQCGKWFLNICFSYGEWSANGDYLQPPGIKTKVNRSQSFSDSGAGLNRNVLLPPDPR